MLVSSFPSQELKLCSIVLDRLEKEVEEKEDMSRKSGKLVSRIPTFQKRSAVGDLPASKNEAPLHDAPETAGIAETPKSKPPDVKETALPLPSVHIPKVGIAAAPVFSSEAQAAASSGAFSSAAPAHADFSLSESAQSPFLMASPRPALRPGQLSDKSSDAEAVGEDASAGILPPEDSACQEPKGDSDFNAEPAKDLEMSPADVSSIDEVAAIMDEEPPWETEPTITADIRDSRSSSDAEPDEDSEDSEHPEPPESQSEAMNLSEKEAIWEESFVAAELSKVSSAESKVRNIPICCFCLSVESYGATPSCSSPGMSAFKRAAFQFKKNHLSSLIEVKRLWIFLLPPPASQPAPAGGAGSSHVALWTPQVCI